MPKGEKIDLATIEAIKAYYAACGSLAKTAKQFGISSQTVMKYRDEEPDRFEEMRSYNKERFIAQAWDNIGNAMSIMPDKFIESTAKDLATVVGILTDKLQLLTGEATSRSENANRNVHSLDDISSEHAKMLIKMYSEPKNE